ncbi:MAG: sortase [Lachnospiraceae bacterium]|nr:sortase [Lachnospiraceae bacterium]
MRNKLGNFFMIAGALLVLAAVLLLYQNRREAALADASAQEILPRLAEQITKDGEELPDPYDTAMKEVEIDGNNYIGYLAIPALGLELPIMSEWNYERLKIAPCRYYGTVKSGDLVIAAHNYERHFGNISKLEEGDEVYFTDMGGVVTRYAVVARDVLEPNAVEEMTAGNYSLTLFTCTYGGKSRVTVYCDMVKE